MRAIKTDFEDKLYDYIGGITRGEKSLLIEIGGTDDHIHVLAKIHPSIHISEIVKKIKGNSSKWLQSENSIPFEWQRGYGAFSVSESIVPKVTHYIQNQKEHHKSISFRDEFLKLLDRNEIKYNEKYLWN